jgi:hypothetical protein
METEGAIRLPFLEWGVAARPMPGETESGDHYFVQPLPAGALLAVIDALGHGPDAAVAARAAVATLRYHAQEPLDTQVKRCHDQLRATNGVVLSIASFRSDDRTLAWLGVGNVECLVMRADSAASLRRVFLVARGGVVGYQLPSLRVTSLTVAEGDTLLFATDGIRHGFHEALNLGDPPQQIADLVLSSHARETDDALVLVARFIGLPPATEARHDEQ